LNKYVQLIELTYCEKYLPVSLIYPLQKSWIPVCPNRQAFCFYVI